MFKVAARYLSGVSVFYGDDITKRDTNGEVAFFIGQATKGPNTPVQLSSVDSAPSIYGTNNPLVKAIYQFYDGYLDSPRLQNIKFVALRIGGIPAALTTSFGLVLSTADSYNGIEDDFYIFIDDTSAANARVKIWNKTKTLVLDTGLDINAGYIPIETMNTGTTGKQYGVDIDNDPLEIPVTIANVIYEDVVKGGYADYLTPAGGSILAGAGTVVAVEAIDLYPSTGILSITESTGAISKRAFVEYVSKDNATKTFTLKTGVTVPVEFGASTQIGLIGSTLIKGDSELDISKREIYEYMRNGLLEIEQYTPDYICPGGISFNDTVTYSKDYTATTTLVANTAVDSTSLLVNAASSWPDTGIITVTDGSQISKVKYSSIAASGDDFRVNCILPTFKIDTIAGDKLSLTIKEDDTLTDVTELPDTGFITLDHLGVVNTYAFTKDPTDSTKLVFESAISGTYVSDDIASQALGAFNTGYTIVTVNYVQVEDFELGLGYVVETDLGDHVEFEWSNVKIANSQIAHFGYLFAKFCNDAAVGYNTPLCGMNVKMPSAFDRASLVSWIGKLPTYSVQGGVSNFVTGVSLNGSGLLGDPVLAGTKNYNRSYLNSANDDIFVDPAYGLLLTDEGFIDGHEFKDDYNNLVDLGKFLCVGAGILTFNNRGATVAYNDGCGIYALGSLAGKPKNEGISFNRIGTGSSTSVAVVVNRNLYNELAGLGYIVVTREKGLGWVINNDNSVARDGSGYYLISTTRLIKYVIEGKRSILVGFIGKPVNTYMYEAAKTSLAESYSSDVSNGFLNGFKFRLDVVEANRAIGKFLLRTSVNPPLELVQVDIDAVIDRGITA